MVAEITFATEPCEQANNCQSGESWSLPLLAAVTSAGSPSKTQFLSLTANVGHTSDTQTRNKYRPDE